MLHVGTENVPLLQHLALEGAALQKIDMFDVDTLVSECRDDESVT